MRKQILLVFLAIILIGFIGLGVHNIRSNNQKLQLNDIELKSKETQLIELNIKYDEVIQLQTQTEKEKQDKLEQIKQLESDRERLERELQAKLDKQSAEKEKLARSAENASGLKIASASSGCNTGNKYKDFIYMKESSCNPSAVNSIGCRGIGQACPGSKLPCGADFACQDAWFSNYAIQRYGSWEAAYNWWLVNHWW